MKNLKVFFLLVLATFTTSLAFCSLGDFLDSNADKTNIFFENFDDSLSPFLERIALEMMEIKEFDEMYSSIVFFCSSLHQQMYDKVVTNIHDEKIVCNEFLTFYLLTLGDQLEGIRSKNDWLGEYVDKYSDELKEAIVISVKRGSESLKLHSPNEQKEEEEDTDFKFDLLADINTDYFTQNSENVYRTALSPEEEESIYEEIWNNSAQFTSPKPSLELSIAAMSTLSYGIRPDDCLFPVARDFLELVHRNNMKIVDPQSIFRGSRSQIAHNSGFDITSAGFQDLCNYVSNSRLPVTSSLYRGPPISKSDKLKVKQEVLMEVAIENMIKLVDHIDYLNVFEVVSSKGIVADSEIVELIICNIKDEVNDFLSSFDLSGGLKTGLISAIEKASNQITEAIQIENGEVLISEIKEFVLQHFQSPLILIKNYDSLEKWNSFYDERKSSKSRKPAEGYPTQKSVTIAEDKKDVLVVQRLSDILEEEDEKVGFEIKPIRRCPSFTGNLEIINSKTFSPSVIKYFDTESTGYFDDYLFSPVVKSTPMTYDNNSIPDFPFENPIEAIKDPVFIEETGKYLAERGDDSCFMLDERIYSIKEGLSAFLSESFQNPSVAESIRRIIEQDIDKTFNTIKSIKNRK